MKHEFICSKCKQSKLHTSGFSTGYGIDRDGNKVCFDCCGINDKEQLTNLSKGEKMCLYMDTQDKTISNWPGTFKINIPFIRTGKHNMAGKRYDTWFRFNNSGYHAVQFGDNTQICHINKIF